MCKCIIAILLADLLTLSLLYTSFIELNIHDDHYNVINLLRNDFEFEGKREAIITMFSYLAALIVHTLAIVIKYIWQLMCCCDCCCGMCGRRDDSDIYYA